MVIGEMFWVNFIKKLQIYGHVQFKITGHNSRQSMQ